MKKKEKNNKKPTNKKTNKNKTKQKETNKTITTNKQTKKNNNKFMYVFLLSHCYSLYHRRTAH